MNTHYFKTSNIKFLLLNIFIFLCFSVQSQSWKTLNANEAKFTCKFPNTYYTQKNSTAYVASCKYNNAIYKTVSILGRDYGKDYNKILDDNIKGFVNSSDKIEKRSKLFKVSGYPAKEVYVKTKNNTYMFYRVVATPTILYQILVMKKNKYEETSKLQKFLNSFSIIK